MSKITIWGVNPLGVAKCYALNVPAEAMVELLLKSRAEGWTNMAVDKRPQPTLWPDDESASSEKQTSPPEK